MFFHVWEDARVWTYWNYSLAFRPSSLFFSILNPASLVVVAKATRGLRATVDHHNSLCLLKLQVTALWSHLTAQKWSAPLDSEYPERWARLWPVFHGRHPRTSVHFIVSQSFPIAKQFCPVFLNSFLLWQSSMVFLRSQQRGTRVRGEG